MIEAGNRGLIHSKRKVISAFFPYAVWRERDGEQGMVGVFLRAVRASKSEYFIWDATRSFAVMLLGEGSPDSLNRIIALASPHILWPSWWSDKKMVARWAAAASTVPYTEEVGQSVVDALLQIASMGYQQPLIPPDSWLWLNKRPTLPPVCVGRTLGTSKSAVSQVRALGDIKILESYLFLVWSEWDWIKGGEYEMSASIRKDFSGIGMWCHRADLIKRLDHVLGELDRGSERLRQDGPTHDEYMDGVAMGQYNQLRDVLLEVDGEEMNTLTRTPSDRSLLFPHLTKHAQDHT